jgi:hypothetical protein
MNRAVKLCILSGLIFAAPPAVVADLSSPAPSVFQKGSGFDLKQCYHRSTTAASVSDGFALAALECTDPLHDVMIDHGFTVDIENADVYLQQQKLILTQNVPTGIKIRTGNLKNGFYNLQIEVVCCPR